jgi:hypothetical protein
MKIKTKKFIGLLPIIAAISLSSLAFADDDHGERKSKEEADRAERKEDKDREERKQDKERAERKEDKEREAKKEEKERAEKREDKEKERADKKEEKEIERADKKEERNEQKEAGDQNLYIGAVLGVTRASGSDGTLSDATLSSTYGLTAGFKLSPRFGLGILASRYGTTSTDTILGLPIGTSSSSTLLLGQLNFIMGGIHFGLEAGKAAQSWDGAISSLTGGTSSSSTVYGPQAGIDFRLDKTITLGLEAHYLFSNAQNVVSNIQALSSIKIWI